MKAKDVKIRNKGYRKETLKQVICKIRVLKLLRVKTFLLFLLLSQRDMVTDGDF